MFLICQSHLVGVWTASLFVELAECSELADMPFGWRTLSSAVIEKSVTHVHEPLNQAPCSWLTDVNVGNNLVKTSVVGDKVAVSSIVNQCVMARKKISKQVTACIAFQVFFKTLNFLIT